MTVRQAKRKSNTVADVERKKYICSTKTAQRINWSACNCYFSIFSTIFFFSFFHSFLFARSLSFSGPESYVEIAQAHTHRWFCSCILLMFVTCNHFMLIHFIKFTFVFQCVFVCVCTGWWWENRQTSELLQRKKAMEKNCKHTFANDGLLDKR